MYFFLVAGIISAIYLSEVKIPKWRRALLGGLCILSIAPSLTLWQRIGRFPENLATPAITKVDTPLFFGSGAYKRLLAQGDNVLILPLGNGNQSLLWQALTDFYFDIASGRLTVIPAEFSRWPVFSAFETGRQILDFPEQLKGFLGAHQVKAVIVDSRDHGPWARLMSEAGLSPLEVGGVLLYKVPPSVVWCFRNVTAAEMARRQAARSSDIR